MDLVSQILRAEEPVDDEFLSFDPKGGELATRPFGLSERRDVGPRHEDERGAGAVDERGT